MVVGFNHNFRYQGEVYHVQTEDSGIKNPHIITLLYRGGTILASKKTSYADIAKVDNLDQVVEDLMKEQHKEMLRRLKDGEFDDVIKGKRPAARATTAPAAEPVPAAAVTAPSPPPAAPVPARPVAAPVAAAPPPPRPATAPPTPPTPKAPPVQKPAEKAPELSLDDVILSYLVGDDK
ncbi:hypothetical protein JCM30471_17790 [Desulfuromonas carbonis]|uniref:hypothetical protein n=1 Tax=Desulfuromonas sp. DDH964 TaxID=1823759 RepID=UPI00078B620B|nr:hypothetical protein [Desulfuromonas sp. DDH964]AMV73364.1 hypothetical protein DBW_3056 [Desulfuromonas sp. DDH964]